MDYDLFQSDDDEEILTAYLEASQQPQQAAVIEQRLDYDNGYEDIDDDEDGAALDVLPEFNCTGRDTVKSQLDFPSNSFVRNGYTLNALPPRSRIDNLRFDFEPKQLKICLVLRYLHGEACKNVQKLCAAVAGQQQLQTKSTANWFAMRQQVTHFYHLLLHEQQTPVGQAELCALLQLRQLLNSCLDAAAWRILYFAEHSKGNDCTTPAYHLYHGALEWRLLDLCVQRKLQDQPEAQPSYEAQLSRLLDDLVLCSQLHYRSKQSVQLLHTSAFMCRCSKELWLLLQQQTDFWPRFHCSMQRHKAQLPMDATLSYHEFYAWLRLSVARLATQDGQQLTAEALQTGCLLQQFLAASPSEQQRRVYLCLLAPLQLDADVLCQLWESLHRSLNCQFNQSTQPQLDQLPLTLPSGAAYLQRYRQLLQSGGELEDLNLNSFTLFALLLGKTLGRTQSQKLLGRIFSKFSAAKLLALNECGIHHVIELFLCLLLSHQGDFAELASKLREMLLCLALDKLSVPRRQLTAKGHMALLLLHAERRQPLEDYIGKLLLQLSTIRNDLDVCAIYASCLPTIFELSSPDFGHGEQLLLGPWLTHYLEHSGQAAQERVWQAMHMLCQRLRATLVATSAGGGGMWQALQQHVLPQLRLQYVSGFSSWLPKLAAQFVLLDSSRKLLTSLLQDAEPVNLAASAQLLLQVLELGLQPTAEQLIQVWLKSLVLLQPQHADVRQLTPHILELPEMQTLELTASALESREPLCAFFGALGRRAQQPDAVAHVRMQLSHKLHAYVAHFERWHVESCASRFYNFIAIVIYNCATLAYVRSKPSCFLHVALTRFLLPTQLQAGVAPEARLLPLFNKIFPVLLQGLGRLPYRQDAYLTRTLEQLVLHWTPHFAYTTNAKLVARPYATLLQADAAVGELSQFVLQQLAQQFLSVQRSQPGQHVRLVLSLLQQLIVGLQEATLDAERQLLTLLKAVHVPLLEHIMFVGEHESSRLQVLQLYRLLVAQTLFQRSPEAQAHCCNDLRSLAEKHLAHCTYFYFQMLIKLAELAPQLFTSLFDFVREQALNVELKRGAGEDCGIRKCLQRLQQVLQGS
ncbi:protein MMS22-like [Drosophila nasuta]|uniref:protein MMS22-like n=1 Tax=Drosophila nasuta TaxID=42062 RepID=UPI00295EA0CA|nr:protein MMS22-like [Drosophila nasuta]